MCSGAKTMVIVSDMYNSHRIGSTIRQTAHVEPFHGISLSNILFRNFYILFYNSVDIVFELPKFTFGQCFGQMIVEFRLLAFDMGAECPAMPVTASHLSVEKMLGCVHRRKLLFVMFVQNRCIHLGFNIIGQYIVVSSAPGK